MAEPTKRVRRRGVSEMTGCRCGWRTFITDPKAAAENVWRHIETAHLHAQLHAGRHVWINGAEQVWECDEDCPHPSHEEQP